MMHSNHFLIMSLKQKLLALYRKEITCLNPKKKTLQRMMQLCKEILQVLEIVEPGISRLKGKLNTPFFSKINIYLMIININLLAQ